jgi:glyoxylase-like metal-dependent hydrolase (beta-lactamase superfamily II)
MHIKFIGTGGAFDYDLGNSAAWVRLHEKNILIDCGHTVYPRLRDVGLANHIDHILITHCHDDHVGSLNTIILHHHFILDQPRKANILVPNLEYRDQLYEFLRFALVEPERYVTFTLASEIPGLTCIDTFGMHIKGMQSYGFIFEDEEEIVAYSGDLGNANIIFDRVLAANPNGKPVRIFHEMAFEPADDIHVHYKDLAPYLQGFDIFAYHLDQRLEPADNLVPLVAHHPELLI